MKGPLRCSQTEKKLVLCCSTNLIHSKKTFWPVSAFTICSCIALLSHAEKKAAQDPVYSKVDT